MYNYKEWLMKRKQFNTINESVQYLTNQQIQNLIKIYQNSNQVIFWKDKIRNIPRDIKPWFIRTLACYQKYKTKFLTSRFRRLNKLSHLQRKNTSGLNILILRYNKDIALQKYNQKKNKCVQNLDNYILRYGEEGKEKYNEYLKKKWVGKEHYIQKYGQQQGLLKWKEHCEKCSKNKSLQRMIQLYGQNEGLEKYKEVQQKNKYCSSKQYFIDKYGEQQGTQIFNNKIDKLHFGSSKEGFIAKYGEKNIEELIRKNKDHFSLEFFQNKYGQQLGYQKWKISIQKRRSLANKVSISSIKTFKPVYDKLLNYFSQDDIFLGTEENGEYSLTYMKNDTTKQYFYDFTILPLKIIFEYNGEVFHARQNMNEQYYKQWEKIHYKVTHQHLTHSSIIKKDKHKKQIAQNNGFTVYYIWQNDINKEEIINNVLKEKGIVI